ncbi:sigma-70 family RNA polymerase sigma factor [Sporolactobacillus shoreae]|uniref:Sigma-70 family RNA polymerase sigma factor n=1 Tax=Sporolactobacillus shoreae TaxID=1465501 RepID=A0A4Z0GIU4_9BACL|nr:sigma-70 family RNA polymerase sigma factor [Sporolactobacillus shoreae]TGA95651.1 sigma-70 family RNA polymerase sigma factor [Sporolactobacillus shoreae]
MENPAIKMRKDREQQNLELIRRYQKGQEDTRNEIIKLNMPFVYYCVRKFKPKDLEYDDAVSLALFAFSKAIDHFDESKGARLPTFLSTVIRNELLMENRKIKRRPWEISIDQPILKNEDGDKLFLIDTIAAPKHEYVDREAVSTVTESVLKKFKEPARQIIIDYLKDEPNQEDQAKKYGLSQSYISRIIANFFKLLKQEAERQGCREKEEYEMPAKALMSVTDCAAYLNHGLTNDEIAKEINATTDQVENFRRNHKWKIEKLVKKQPKTAEKGPKREEIEDPRIPVLENNMDTVIKTNARLKNQLNDAEKQIAALIKDKKDLLDSTQGLAATKRQVEALLEDKKDLLKSIREQAGGIQKLRDKNESLTDDNAEQTELTNQAYKEIDQVKQQLGEIQQSADHYQKLYLVTYDNLQKLDRKLKAAKQYIHALTASE